jgi:hypothetical protein
MPTVSDAIKTIVFHFVSHMFHHPWLLRLVTGAFRRWPGLNRLSPSPVIATRDGVQAVMARSADFSHSPYISSLVAGDFVIGMDDGPQTTADRRMLAQWLKLAHPPGSGAAVESRRLLAGFQNPGRASIDLINDYLIWVVWAELKKTLGAGAAAILNGDATAEPLLMELRYLGSHLVIGWTAPAKVQKRAEDSAASVNRRVRLALGALVNGFPGSNTEDVLRNAIGMMWVGHPATVQAGALVIQELFARPDVHKTLTTRAVSLGNDAWSNQEFRIEVGNHIVELLRFRPVFPFLPRTALRDTWCDIGGGQSMPVKAGSRLVVATIGAMFDAEAQWAPAAFHPGRYAEGWGRHPEDKLLMFGLGARRCVAEHLVIDILISAIIGLLKLPQLRWPARMPFDTRITYDGVIITRMPVVFN